MEAHQIAQEQVSTDQTDDIDSFVRRSRPGEPNKKNGWVIRYYTF